jgi:transketolase
MRNAFAKTITKLAKKNKKIILLSGDIGNKLFDEFKKKCPSQFYNCGVAENNMVGVASGLAKLGFIPFVYTITPFLVARSYEQIKIDVCYSNLGVTIVGTGAGLSYSRLGPTHHSLDDLSLMQSIPNIRILCPGDSIEVEALLEQTVKKISPTYFRLGKKGEPLINTSKKKIKIGKANLIVNGKDILVICVGNTIGIGQEINKSLEEKKIRSTILSYHTIKPINFKELQNYIKNFKKIVIIEEHSVYGGFSSTIKNFFYKKLHNKKIITICTPDLFLNGLGEQNEARNKLGFSAKSVIKKILSE